MRRAERHFDSVRLHGLDRRYHATGSPGKAGRGQAERLRIWCSLVAVTADARPSLELNPSL